MHWSRALIALGLGLALAVWLGAHAASLVLTKSDPDLAASLSTLNGAAKEERAFARFQSEASSSQVALAAARRAAPLAREALRANPLAPRALAILALSEEDASKRGDFLRLAARFNRRDLTLQGLVLRDSIEASRARASLATLDQILRVHKDRYDEFLPLLVEALTRSETLPAFRRILAKDARWHRTFFDRANEY